MKLKEINYSFYNNDGTTIIPFGVKSFPSVKVNKDQETPTVETIENVTPTFRMSTDYFYMVFSGSIELKDRVNNTNTVIPGNLYDSSEFVDYQDILSNWNNSPIDLIIDHPTTMLRFCIDDDTFPPLSVKALTVSNSEVNINTNNDTIVIVIGKHSFNGKDVGERKIIHYRIMDQDQDSANVIHSGIATISTPETCRVVYIEKK